MWKTSKFKGGGHLNESDIEEYPLVHFIQPDTVVPEPATPRR